MLIFIYNPSFEPSSSSSNDVRNTKRRGIIPVGSKLLCFFFLIFFGGSTKYLHDDAIGKTKFILY